MSVGKKLREILAPPSAPAKSAGEHEERVRTQASDQGGGLQGWIRRHPGWTAVIAILNIGGIASAASSSKKSHAHSHAAATTKTPSPKVSTAHTARPKQASTSKPKPVISGSQKDALAYIKSLGQDADRVQASIQVVQISVGELQQTATQSNLNQLAQDAQQAHDNLDSIRQDFANTTTDSGELGNAQTEVFAAANDLKNAMGALVAYTGNPNPATLAHFTTRYQNAKGEWNDGIKMIWRAAHQGNPPTV